MSGLFLFVNECHTFFHVVYVASRTDNTCTLLKSCPQEQSTISQTEGIGLETRLLDTYSYSDLQLLSVSLR